MTDTSKYRWKNFDRRRGVVIDVWMTSRYDARGFVKKIYLSKRPIDKNI